MPRPADEPLTFYWPDHGDISLALPAMIALAALLHATGFYLFQIIYPPPAGATVPPPTELAIITPDLEGAAATLDWLEAWDPTRAARASEVLPPAVFAPPYAPSFARIRTMPEMVYETPPPLRFPPAVGASDLFPPVAAAAPAPQEPPRPPPSQVTFSPCLAARQPVTNPPLRIAKPVTRELKPARFLVGLAADGALPLVFLLASSDNPEIDRLCADHLARVRFDGRPGVPVVWGEALFEFGADAYAKPPPPQQPEGGR